MNEYASKHLLRIILNIAINSLCLIIGLPLLMALSSGMYQTYLNK